MELFEKLLFLFQWPPVPLPYGYVPLSVSGNPTCGQDCAAMTIILSIKKMNFYFEKKKINFAIFLFCFVFCSPIKVNCMLHQYTTVFFVLFVLLPTHQLLFTCLWVYDCLHTDIAPHVYKVSFPFLNIFGLLIFATV